MSVLSARRFSGYVKGSLTVFRDRKVHGQEVRFIAICGNKTSSNWLLFKFHNESNYPEDMNPRAGHTQVLVDARAIGICY